MSFKKQFIALIIILATASLAVPSVSYGAACPFDPWYPDSTAKGDEWVGTIFIRYEFTEATDLPPASSPIPVPGLQDAKAKMEFVLKLRAKNQRPALETFSGTGLVYHDPINRTGPTYTTFYVIGNYCDWQGWAVHEFLKTIVYPALCGTEDCGALKSVIEENGNTQQWSSSIPTAIDPNVTPLYHSAEITIVAPVRK